VTPELGSQRMLAQSIIDRADDPEAPNIMAIRPEAFLAILAALDAAEQLLVAAEADAKESCPNCGWVL
jgi:hypothetical protein